MPDLARDGLRTLQQRMLQATVAAQSPAELVAVQRDLVAGARRLGAALEAAGQTARDGADLVPWRTALAEAEQFRQDAEAALRQYEQAAVVEAQHALAEGRTPLARHPRRSAARGQ